MRGEGDALWVHGNFFVVRSGRSAIYTPFVQKVHRRLVSMGSFCSDEKVRKQHNHPIFFDAIV